MFDEKASVGWVKCWIVGWVGRDTR